MNTDERGESSRACKFCWVQTKWGRYKAKILLETITDNKHYVIVETIDNQFKFNFKTQIINKNNIDYI